MFLRLYLKTNIFIKFTKFTPLSTTYKETIPGNFGQPHASTWKIQNWLAQLIHDNGQKPCCLEFCFSLILTVLTCSPPPKWPSPVNCTCYSLKTIRQYLHHRAFKTTPLCRYRASSTQGSVNGISGTNTTVVQLEDGENMYKVSNHVKAIQGGNGY